MLNDIVILYSTFFIAVNQTVLNVFRVINYLTIRFNIFFGYPENKLRKHKRSHTQLAEISKTFFLIYKKHFISYMLFSSR